MALNQSGHIFVLGYFLIYYMYSACKSTCSVAVFITCNVINYVDCINFVASSQNDYFDL